MDAAREAELAAAKLLADLQARVRRMGLSVCVPCSLLKRAGLQLWREGCSRMQQSCSCSNSVPPAPPRTLPQAADAKQAVEASQRRLAQLQERCAGEEERLGALQAAVLEQRQRFDAQVGSLLDMGQQVRLPLWRG